MLKKQITVKNSITVVYFAQYKPINEQEFFFKCIVFFVEFPLRFRIKWKIAMDQSLIAISQRAYYSTIRKYENAVCMCIVMVLVAKLRATRLCREWLNQFSSIRVLIWFHVLESKTFIMESAEKWKQTEFSASRKKTVLMRAEDCSCFI